MTDVRDDLRGVARTLRRLAEWDREDGLIGYPSDSPTRLAELIAQIPRTSAPPVEALMAAVSSDPGEGAAMARSQVVAEGPERAALVFVGAAPGHMDDPDGRPFGGAAGELLDKMITAMGLRRQDVVLLTVALGGLDGGSSPSERELGAVIADHLDRIAPSVAVTLGEALTRTVTGATASLHEMRSHFHLVVLPSGHTLEILPTLPPAHLLSSPGDKRGVWEDLRRVMGALGLPGGLPREPTS